MFKFIKKKSKIHSPDDQIQIMSEIDESEYSIMEKTVSQKEISPVNLTIGVSSVIGTRKYQQDAADVVIDIRRNTLGVLCDGMGGMEGGELASALCVQTFCDDFIKQEQCDFPQFLCRALKKADLKVSNLRSKKGSVLKAGTTVLAVIVSDNKLYWVSAGDSRIYLIRGAEIVQVTKDHNYSLILKEQVRQELLSKEDAESHGGKEALISYVGMGSIARLEVNEQPFILADGDYILMCSDGLYKTMDEKAMKRIIEMSPDDMPEAAALLTEAASSLAMDGQDNTTVIIMKYRK